MALPRINREKHLCKVQVMFTESEISIIMEQMKKQHFSDYSSFCRYVIIQAMGRFPQLSLQLDIPTKKKKIPEPKLTDEWERLPDL